MGVLVRRVDALKDDYFIPAIASIGALVLVSLLCCFFLGWCFNRRRMNAFWAGRSSSSPQQQSIEQQTMPYSNVRPGSYGEKAGTGMTASDSGSRRSSKIHRKTSGLNGSLRNPSSPLSGKDSLGTYPDGRPGSLPMNYQGSGHGGFRGFAGVGTFSHATSHAPSVATSIQQTAKERFYSRQPVRSQTPLHPANQTFVSSSTRPEIQDDGPATFPPSARLGVGAAAARPITETERSSATLSYVTDPALKGSPNAQQQAFNIAQSYYPPQPSTPGNGSRAPFGTMPAPAPGPTPGFSPSGDDKRWSEYDYSPSDTEAANQWIPPPPGQGARRSAMLSQTSTDSSYGQYRPRAGKEGPSSSGYPAGPAMAGSSSWAGTARPSSEKPPR